MAMPDVQTMQITLPVKKVLTIPSSKRISNRSGCSKSAEPSPVGLFRLKDGGAVTASADNDLTNLNWLQKPHVLNSLCSSLAESPARVRAMRRMPAKRTGETKTNIPVNGERYDSDKAFDSILAVRNRRTGSGRMPTKPPLSFACMIFMAIESSPDKMLPVREIYNWIMKKFPFFRTASPGWKNSVRHNLSLNKCFRKVEKSIRNSPSASPVSKGSCWAVDKEYRKSLLTALKRTPYHPYHQYFTPCSDGFVGLSGIEAISVASSKPFDTAEKEAAFTMCMISNTPDRNTTPVTPIILHAIELDHSYAKKPQKNRGLCLADVAAAASLLHFQSTLDGAGSPCSNHSDGRESIESSDIDDVIDKDYDFTVMESEEELEVKVNKLENSLSDSGYVDTPQLLAKHVTMEELGVNALLHLANSPALVANCNSNNSNTPSISPSLEQFPPKFTSTPAKDSIQVLPINPVHRSCIV